MQTAATSLDKDRREFLENCVRLPWQPERSLGKAIEKNAVDGDVLSMEERLEVRVPGEEGDARELRIRAGIPDLRMSEAPYMTLEQEEPVVEDLLNWSATHDFCGLVCTYIHHHTQLPVDIKNVYIHNRTHCLERAAWFLFLLDEMSWRAGIVAERPKPPLGGPYDMMNAMSGQDLGVVFDLGCGVAGQLVLASRRAKLLVGMDAGFTELVLARRLLLEHGCQHKAMLMGANAEHLPLADESVDTIFARDVIEHFDSQPGALAEAWRVLRPGGRILMNSPNRYMLWTPEPHVQMHWLGFMPRSWMETCTMKMKKMPYQGNRLLGLGELTGMLKALEPRPKHILVRGVLSPGMARENIHPAFRWMSRALLRDRVNAMPIVRWFAPEHLVLLQKPLN